MSVLSDLIDLALHTRAGGGGSPGKTSVITLPHTINRAALLCMETFSKDLQHRANVETPDDCKALTNMTRQLHFKLSAIPGADVSSSDEQCI